MTPNGTKRTIGFLLMLLPYLAAFFGYEVADVAPIEIAALSDTAVGIIGGIVLIYGTIRAKGPMWFTKSQ